MNMHQAHLSLLLSCLLHLTGVLTGAPLRTHDITTTAGNDVTLRCELLLEDTKVTQVNWNFCNEVHIGFHVNNYKIKGQVVKEFSHRMSLAKDYGITISNVNGNDTGLYCCIYNTFPHGKYVGKIYLQVLAKGFPWTREHYIWIFMGFGILLLVTGSIGIFYYKRKSRGIPSRIRPISSPAKPADPTTPSSVPTLPAAEEEDNSQPQEYFNVILYKDIYTI
ncbi:T-cell immunoreceptor with Ig and ITIM domains isoform X1 [Mixophyes fleayi]|uniref:T-cell immunoreceptor with Ig and ITIM domains isoform X1 n=1 Tax=Mixophyes fleayi TaxID=3061075 RepID=UPI003F4E1000